jgi:hypothetical protein
MSTCGTFSTSSNSPIMSAIDSPTPRIIVAGRDIDAPSAQIGGYTVISTGRWLKIARLYDEEVTHGIPVSNPEQFIQGVRDAHLGADLFTFAHRPLLNANYLPYRYELDNYAAIPISSYEHWLTKQIETDVRQNVKKAPRRGIVTRITPFDDALVKGISDIYNESPIRQGRIFWHYGKSLERIRIEAGRYLDRSDFVGAYVGEELVGFIKLTYTDENADLGLIVTKLAHFEKRPTNALIAKAVERCAERGISRLRYDKMSYGKKSSASLADFKRRHGFVELSFPRYFVPLTAKGHVVLELNLHRPLQDYIPDRLQMLLLGVRAKWYARRVSGSKNKITPSPQ